jgi:hypothetical protein
MTFRGITALVGSNLAILAHSHHNFGFPGFSPGFVIFPPAIYFKLPRRKRLPNKIETLHPHQLPLLARLKFHDVPRDRAGRDR